MKFKLQTAKDMIKNAPIKILLYADSGIGKTTLAVTAPKPIVILTELQAIPSINLSNPDAAIVHCSSLQEVRNVLSFIKTKNDNQFETLVIDSLTETQRMIKDEIISTKDADKRDNFSMRDWGILADKTRSLIRLLRDLPINVVCTALMDNATDDDGSKRILYPKFEGQRTGKEIAQWFNLIGLMHRKENDEGIKRYLRFSGPDSILCKNAQPLPPVIIDPNLTDIFNQIQNKGKK